ncbi:MAG: pectinesterase family protein [Massilia sp.]
MSARLWFMAGVLFASSFARAQLADGWAGQQGGTSGGGAGIPITVTTAAELRAAVASGAGLIEIAGIIDMREGTPYVSNADQARRGVINLDSNTTLSGAGSGSGLINASVIVSKASNVIIRHLNFRNPCDVAPRWDPDDGAKGNWNSLYDAITISASTHVWIDHNSFTDAPFGDQLAPIEFGMMKQCHDGALDITKGSDLITVSYNRFSLHEKNGLIGSSDNATGDIGHLRVTYSNNLFENVSSRTPRVRFGQVHLYNNYHVGDRKHLVYRHEYSIGVGKRADIIVDANAYDIAGARSCADIVHSYGTDGSIADHGSTLNGAPLGACSQISAPSWQVPYPFQARPAADVKAHVLANAGAGNWHMDSTRDGAIVALAPALVPPESGDYFVQARVKASRANARGHLYLMGRHDGSNWVGAGVYVANGTMEVNVVRMQGGVLTRLKQLRRVASGPPHWDLLRMDLKGAALTVYLNGESLGTVQDPNHIQSPGAVGFYSKGNAFDIDELRIGNAGDKPARIVPSLATGELHMQAGDAPHLLPISALASDGQTRIGFTASVDQPTVAGVEVRDGGIIVTPRKAGTATIVLASTADSSVQTTLTVSVGVGFAMPAAVLENGVFPPARARDVPVDTSLRLRLGHPLALGSGGSVRIYRKSDLALVDTIRPYEEVMALGPVTANLRRYARRNPVTVVGNGATFRPHSGVLAYDTEYLVALGNGVIDGVAGAWTFRTRKAPASGATLTVDDDGAADFRTVQGALDYAMTVYPRTVPVTIEVRNGSYDELLFLRARDRVTIHGESRDGVMIHATNNDGLHPGSGTSQAPGSPGVTGGRSVMLVEDADLLTLENLTLKNDSQRRTSLSGQAETIFFNSDSGRLIARDATFISEQDTLQLKGYAWFYRTLVAGNVDFIWGANHAALFEQSEIRSLGDSANGDSGGYIVQARTVAPGDSGFVFLDSRLTRAAGPAGNAIPDGRTFLARSQGSPTSWDNVSYINCQMDSHIASAGWTGTGSGWREAGSTDLSGHPLDLALRRGGQVIDANEARRKFGTRSQVFAGFDGGKGWDPQP